MSAKWIIAVGALLAAAGVGLGAFGAHGLEDFLRRQGYEADLEKRMAWFETGVRYQLYHAIGLLAVAALGGAQASGGYRGTAWLLILGVALFSGSLYAMTFINKAGRILVIMTPLGGLLLIVGWIVLATTALRK